MAHHAAPPSKARLITGTTTATEIVVAVFCLEDLPREGVEVMLLVLLPLLMKVLMGLVPLQMALANLPALYCLAIQLQSKSEFRGSTVILSFTVRSPDRKMAPAEVLLQ